MHLMYVKSNYLSIYRLSFILFKSLWQKTQPDYGKRNRGIVSMCGILRYYSMQVYLTLKLVLIKIPMNMQSSLMCIFCLKGIIKGLCAFL